MTKIRTFTVTAVAAAVGLLGLLAYRARSPAGVASRTAPMWNAASMPRLPSMPDMPPMPGMPGMPGMPSMPRMPGMPNVAGFSGAAPNSAMGGSMAGVDVRALTDMRQGDPGAALGQRRTLDATTQAPRSPDNIFGGRWAL